MPVTRNQTRASDLVRSHQGDGSSSLPSIRAEPSPPRTHQNQAPRHQPQSPSAVAAQFRAVADELVGELTSRLRALADQFAEQTHGGEGEIHEERPGPNVVTGPQTTRVSPVREVVVVRSRQSSQESSEQRQSKKKRDRIERAIGSKYRRDEDDEDLVKERKGGEKKGKRCGKKRKKDREMIEFASPPLTSSSSSSFDASSDSKHESADKSSPRSRGPIDGEETIYSKRRKYHPPKEYELKKESVKQKEGEKVKEAKMKRKRETEKGPKKKRFEAEKDMIPQSPKTSSASSHSSSSSSSSSSRSDQRSSRAQWKKSPNRDVNSTPFRKRITKAPIPKRFRMPDLDKYDGTTDPREHIQNYKGLMEVQGADDPLLCKAFQVTLRKSAKDWYNDLPRRSIGSFSELARAFSQQFMASRRRKRSSDHLLTLRQREGESLRGFMDRFNEEKLQVENCISEVAVIALRQGVRNEDLKKSMYLKPPRSFDELLTRVNRFMVAEEAIEGCSNDSRAWRPQLA